MWIVVKSWTKSMALVVILAFLMLAALTATADGMYGYDVKMFCPVCEAGTFWNYGCSDDPDTEAWLTVDGVDYKYCPTDLICVYCGNHYRVDSDELVHVHSIERDADGVHVFCPFRNESDNEASIQ
jgi:hypothetical protein